MQAVNELSGEERALATQRFQRLEPHLVGIEADTLQSFLQRKATSDPESRHLYLLDESSLARHVEHGYAVESGRRVSADRFIVSGDTAEAKTLKSVPAQARDLSIHTSAPPVQQHEAPEREKTPQHEQAQKPPQRDIQRGQGIGLSL